MIKEALDKVRSVSPKSVLLTEIQEVLDNVNSCKFLLIITHYELDVVFLEYWIWLEFQKRQKAFKLRAYFTTYSVNVDCKIYIICMLE